MVSSPYSLQDTEVHTGPEKPGAFFADLELLLGCGDRKTAHPLQERKSLFGASLGAVTPVLCYRKSLMEAITGACGWWSGV